MIRGLFSARTSRRSGPRKGNNNTIHRNVRGNLLLGFLPLGRLGLFDGRSLLPIQRFCFPAVTGRHLRCCLLHVFVAVELCLLLSLAAAGRTVWAEAKMALVLALMERGRRARTWRLLMWNERAQLLCVAFSSTIHIAVRIFSTNKVTPFNLGIRFPPLYCLGLNKSIIERTFGLAIAKCLVITPEIFGSVDIQYNQSDNLLISERYHIFPQCRRVFMQPASLFRDPLTQISHPQHTHKKNRRPPHPSLSVANSVWNPLTQQQPSR